MHVEKKNSRATLRNQHKEQSSSQSGASHTKPNRTAINPHKQQPCTQPNHSQCKQLNTKVGRVRAGVASSVFVFYAVSGLCCYLHVTMPALQCDDCSKLNRPSWSTWSTWPPSPQYLLPHFSPLPPGLAHPPGLCGMLSCCRLATTVHPELECYTEKGTEAWHCHGRQQLPEIRLCKY